MSNIPSSLNYIQQEGVDFRRPIGQSITGQIGASINGLLDDKTAQEARFATDESNIATNTANIATNAAAIATESSTRAAADAAINADINTNIRPVTTLFGGLQRVISASCGNFILDASTGAEGGTVIGYHLIPNFDLTITTHGRPVKIQIFPDPGPHDTGGGQSSFFQIGSSDPAQSRAVHLFSVFRDGDLLPQLIQTTRFESVFEAGGGVSTMPISVITFLDVPGSGTYRYKIRVSRSNTASNFVGLQIFGAIMMLEEI